jgi:hypothetical protein
MGLACEDEYFIATDPSSFVSQPNQKISLFLSGADGTAMGLMPSTRRIVISPTLESLDTEVSNEPDQICRAYSTMVITMDPSPPGNVWLAPPFVATVTVLPLGPMLPPPPPPKGLPPPPP